jgi:hypothetical protein
MRSTPSATKACNDADVCPPRCSRVRGMSLAAPLDAQARSKMHIGLLPDFSPHPLGALHRDAVEVFARAARRPGQAGHPRYDRRHSLCDVGQCWVPLAGVRGPCPVSGGRAAPRYQHTAWRRDHHHGPKRGEGIGESGHNIRRVRKASRSRTTIATSERLSPWRPSTRPT